MLQPSPEYRERLDEKERILNEKIEAKAIKNELLRIGTLKFLSSTAIFLTGFVGLPIAYYAQDVRTNQEIQSHASIEIDTVGQAIDSANNDKAILFVDGFGTNNGDAIAENMGSAIQPLIDAQRWSMNLNNASLDKDKLVQKIIETAHEKGVTTLWIVTHSAGGNIMAPTIVPLIEESNLTIPVVIFDSTPYDLETLRPARQSEVELVKKFILIPGAEDSSELRRDAEALLRSDNYTHGDNVFENISDFITTKNEVDANLKNNQLHGTRLMIDQLASIEKANFKKTIKDISELPATKVRPVLIYAKTAHGADDGIVDVDKTEKKLEDDVMRTKGKVRLISLDIPGAVHTRPDLATDSYKKVFASAKLEIAVDITEEAVRASLHRVTSMMPYNPSKMKPEG